MRLAIAVLGSVATTTALAVGGVPKKREIKAIDPEDFVYVDGLRLKDASGLHYVTVRFGSSRLDFI